MRFTEAEASSVASEMQNEVKRHPWMRVLFTGQALYGKGRTPLGEDLLVPHMTLLGRTIYGIVPWFNNGLKSFDGATRGTVFTYQTYVAANDGLRDKFTIVEPEEK